MIDKNEKPSENELGHQQKYFICFECCFWIYQLIVIALGAAIMARVIISYQNTQSVLKSDLYQHAQETVWLWNQGYIIDIRAEKTNNCPEGYSPLITYTWSGTTDGCHCQSTANNYTFEFVLVGKCSSQLISMGCDTINAMSAEVLNMWKGKQLICYKRAKSMTFYNSVLTTAPSGGTSPNMTACASGQNYQAYTLPGVTCPITAVSNATLGGNQTSMVLDETYNYNMNFVTQSGYPIAHFKLSEYQFCDFFNTTNISPNKQGTYMLLSQSLSNPCPLTDPRMIKIDSLNEEDFYTNNTRVYQLITTLPAYPKPSVDYQYQLGYIPYPSWTFQCRNSTKYNLYTTTSHILFENASASMILTVSITVPCILVLIVLFRLFHIIRHVVDLKSRSSYNALMLTQDEIVEQLPNVNIKKSYKKEFLLFLIELLLLCAVAGSIIYSVINFTNDSVWIKEIMKLQCTDNFLQNIFLYYEGVIDVTSMWLLEMTFVWAVLFIIHIIFFATRVQIGDLFVKKEIVEEIPSESQQPLQILEKQGKIEGVSMQDSSQIILLKDKENNSELKVYDMDFMMNDGAGETKDNFFGSLQRQASINVVKKKKKKKTSAVVTNKKKKNLFKQDQQ